ncbi:MAG TPA: VanZ family protein [Gemmatimonadales bacterium]
MPTKGESRLPSSPVGTARPGLAVLAARLAYIGVLALATLAPFHFDFTHSGLAQRLENALTFGYSVATAVDAISNVVLFAGWGALWAATSRMMPLGPALRLPAITGGILSITAETLQLFVPGRRTSLLDVGTNTAGAIIGAAAVVLAVHAAQAVRHQKSYVGLPAAGFALAYLGAVLFEALLPLQRVAVLPTDRGNPLRRLRTATPEFEWESIWRIPLTDVVLFFPLGALAVMALVELGWGHWRAARAVAGWGGLVSIAVEVAHGPLGLPVQLGSALAHLVGIALGAVVCAQWLPAFSRRVRGRGRPAVLFVAYAALIAFWAWRPFAIEMDGEMIRQQFSLERLVPLQGLASRDLFTVADVVKPFFLFFPLGALLAVWPLRRSGALGYFLPALYLAAITEVGQGFVEGRFFDGTDLLIQCAAAAIGWLVVRQAGYEAHGGVLGA